MSEPSGVKQGTKKVAEFICNTSVDSIPKEAYTAAKIALLDHLGVAITGSNEDCSKLIIAYVKEQNSKKEASVICQKFKTSAELAALANGTAGHALDYDDTIVSSVHYNLHPSVPIFPAALALGEKYNLSGAKVLSGYIVGLEVQYRVGLAMGQRIAPSGWHSTAILGTIGSLAAAANLLQLNENQTRMALGISGSLTGGMVRNLDTNTKPMHAGNAARSGIFAATLAKSGFGANPSILDDQFSFCGVFSEGKILDIGNNADNLSKQWDIIARGLTYKPYPCCRAIHASIEAVQNLREMYKFSAAQVDSIVCKTHPVIPIFASRHKPLTGYEGKFSVGYCLAAAILTGNVLLEDFTDEKVNDPERQALTSKVSFVHPPGWGTGTVDLKAEVIIKLKNGQEYSYLVNDPKGEPGNPMSDEEFLGKFKNCAGMMFKDNQIDKIIDLVMHLDKQNDLSDLMNVLTFKK
jgi:2-methylcitrate dehydratase PrpD